MDENTTREEMNEYVKAVRKIKAEEIEKLMLAAFQHGLRLGLQKTIA